MFIVHGTLINFLYAGQHELSHGTPFKTKALNEWVGRVIGFLMIFPRDFDWIQHSAHHQHTSDWEKDGELVRQPYTLRSYLLWVLGPTYWYSRVARIVRFCRGIVVKPYVRPDQESIVIREARVHAALYAAIAIVSIGAQSWAAVIFWLAPMLATKPIHQLQNTIEHLGLSHEDDILKNTRSTDTNALLRWMCWNMQYHTAHHSFPSVPFWKLRTLNDTIEDRIGHEVHRMGYIEFQIDLLKSCRAESPRPIIPTTTSGLHVGQRASVRWWWTEVCHRPAVVRSEHRSAARPHSKTKNSDQIRR